MTPPFPYGPPPGLLRELRGGGRSWLVPHTNSDADSLGSMLACAGALRQLGHEVVVLRHDEELPPAYLELPGMEHAVLVDDAPPAPDRLLLFDFQQAHRSGGVVGRAGGATAIVIDHHPVDGGEDFADERWILPGAAATAMLVHSLVLALDEVELTPDMAHALYAALLTDTGGFRFSNTSRDAFVAAADLVARGALPGEIAEALMHRRRPQALRLMAGVLDSADYRLGGRVALLYVTRDLLERTGGEMAESEGIVNLFSSAEGVDMAALLREEGDGEWRVSLRSGGRCDVREVAVAMGGGGHKRAAAFSSTEERPALEARLLGAMGDELERARAGTG